MANSELPDLTEDTSPSSSDIGYTVKDPAGSPLDRKATWLNILKGAALGLLTSDGDLFTRASGAAARITRASLAADSAFTTAFAPYSARKELARVEFTSSVSVTATTEATADSVVSAGAVSFDGSTVVDIEFFSPAARASAATGALLTLVLYDGSSSIGQLSLSQSQAANNASRPVFTSYRLTPSNASHTYSVRGFVSTGTGSVSAGTGGSGNFMPGYIRIITKPQV